MTKLEQIEMYMTTQIDAFTEVLEEQTGKGQKKYGKTTDPMDNYSWPKMVKEELVDAFVYTDMMEKRTAFIASKLRNLMNYKRTEQTLMEINHWLDILEGRDTNG